MVETTAMDEHETLSGRFGFEFEFESTKVQLQIRQLQLREISSVAPMAITYKRAGERAPITSSQLTEIEGGKTITTKQQQQQQRQQRLVVSYFVRRLLTSQGEIENDDVQTTTMSGPSLHRKIDILQV